MGDDWEFEKVTSSENREKQLIPYLLGGFAVIISILFIGILTSPWVWIFVPVGIYVICLGFWRGGYFAKFTSGTKNGR